MIFNMVAAGGGGEPVVTSYSKTGSFSSSLSDYIYFIQDGTYTIKATGYKFRGGTTSSSPPTISTATPSGYEAYYDGHARITEESNTGESGTRTCVVTVTGATSMDDAGIYQLTIGADTYYTGIMVINVTGPASVEIT